MTATRNMPIYLRCGNQLVKILSFLIECPIPHTLCSVLWFRFGLSFAKIPIGFGNKLLHGKLASCCVYNDPGINGEFVIVAGPAGPQDEMNTKGVVTFHPISFLRYQSLFA
jgi:hypothetical protein